MDDNLFLFGLILGAAICGAIGYTIGQSRGRGPDGLGLGLFLGPIGCIIAALLPEKGLHCPECLGVVPRGARRCKHCGVAITKEPLREAALQIPPSAAFYVLRADKTEGPFSRKQLQILVSTQALARETLCARKGDSNWVELRSII